MTVTLTGIWNAAEELACGNGKATPSMRLALWAAVLSPRNDIGNNGKQVDALRSYATGGLPLTGNLDRDAATIQDMVATCGGKRCTGVHARGIINIERMARAGELDLYAHKPRTLQAWLLWRAGIAKLYGMSWKTASFAALLLWPFECPFVPVDSHVCARLGRMDLYKVISGKTGPAYHRYRILERTVYAELRQAGNVVPVGVWHWYKWEEHRQATDKKAGDGSHLSLSPYYY